MKEIIVSIISAVITSMITCMFTMKLETHKERREAAAAAKKEQREIYEKRPEMDILKFKDYLSRPGYGIKQRCDIELFVAHIDHVTVEGNGKKGRKKKEWVLAHFDVEDKDPSQWCCVIYTFKNVGKTDISTMNIICHYQKDTCIFPYAFAEHCLDSGMLNYSECHDRKIRSGETVTVKLCYHKDRILRGAFSANMSIGMQDDNGHYWQQPLFAPTDKVYDSRQINWKEYKTELLPDAAIECFKKPWLW